MPARLLPVLERTDYVANSNNTYWLTNPKAPITGLPSVNGRAETDPGPRAQAGLRDIESRLAGRDGLAGSRFDAEAVKALVFGSQAQPDLGNRVRAAEMMAPGLGDICRDATPVAMAEGPAVDIGEACRVLAAWDRRSNTASVGAHVFREFWTVARRTPNLWRRAFDPRNPLETPAEPRTDDPAVRTALRQALGGAARRLAAAGIPLDRPWGELQFQEVKGAAVPLYGDQGEIGVLNAMAAGPPAKGRYGPVVHGASYVQLVGFDARGPVAESVLLYGQSSDPASPHYFDQLPELWAKRRWAPMPFTAAQRERARVLSRVRLTE
jgi:acyl-homoserine-lactone acylase